MPRPRPLRRALLAAAVALAALPAGAQQVATGKAPRAVVPAPIFDAGSVGRGAPVRHEFVLRNEGDAVLHVREVQPSCGCTVVEFDSTIAPQGEGRVIAEVETGAFRGAIAKDLTVLTSDPANPSIVLTVRADVQPWVDAAPGYFHFLHVQGAPPPTATQTIWSVDRPELTVLGVESGVAALAVTFRPAADGERQPDVRGRQWVVAAALDAEAASGPLAGDVVVRTDHPQQPELVIPLGGYVRPLLMVSPPRADFGAFAPSEPRKGSVIVTNHGEAPVQVLSADSDVPGLSAEVAVREKGKKYDVNLTLAAGTARGPFRGTLRVRTDSPRSPVLEIPVQGEVR